MPVILYAAAVIIAMLLMYPWYINEQKHISARILRWALYSLIPALPMFFIALGVRIGALGITVPRYLGILVGVWFVYIVIYALACRCTYMKRYFIVAIALLLFASYGPWSAFSVSQTSQSKRFIALVEEKGFLDKNGLFDEEKYANASFEDMFAVQDRGRYIHDNYSFDEVRYLFGDPTASMEATDEVIADVLDIGFWEPVDRPLKNAKQIVFFAHNGIGTHDIESYEVLIDIEQSEAGSVLYDKLGTRIELGKDARLMIMHGDKSITKDVREILNQYAFEMDAEQGSQNDPIVIELEQENFRARVILQGLFGYLTQDALEVTGANGVVLLDVR